MKLLGRFCENQKNILLKIFCKNYEFQISVSKNKICWNTAMRIWFKPKWQSPIAVTETIWPTKPQTFDT